MFGIGIAHGKFGELLQGVLPGKNTDFLVTVPIPRYSVSAFRYYNNSNDKEAIVYPSNKTKSAFLAKKILGYFELPHRWALTIDSELEAGKGLGSSTADMVACVRAINHALGKVLPLNIFLKFLKEIEPSDGIMHEGVVCFYHRQVALHSQLGYLSGLVIIGVDEGGVVDTISFNYQTRLRSAAEKLEYEKLLNEVIVATKKNDLIKIGEVATRSAILHQKFNPKKNLSYFIDLSNQVGALGVMIAHSGTYIGIMLDKNMPNYLQKLTYIEKKMKDQSLVAEVFDVISNEQANFVHEKVG